MTGFFDMFKNLFSGSSKSKSIEERLSAIEKHLGIKPTVESGADEEAPLMGVKPPVELPGVNKTEPPGGLLGVNNTEPPGGLLGDMGGVDKQSTEVQVEDNKPEDNKPGDNKPGNIKPVGGRKSKKGTRKGKRPEGKKTRGR